MLKTLFMAVALLFSLDPAAAQTPPGAVMSAPPGGMTMDTKPKSKTIAIVLFPGFQPLDVYGPAEMWGGLPDHKVVFVAEKAGPVRGAFGLDSIATVSFADAPQFDVVMVPGGGGTRREVNNPAMLDFLRRQDRGTSYTTSVCTGAAVLAKAGLLDGRRATTNKMAYRWATGQGDKVRWVGHARWVIDGKYVTSSGVSAGMDMALALVEKLYGRDMALQRARFGEYVWNQDPDNDPFAVEAGAAAR